jgi:hypothetical protein
MKEQKRKKPKRYDYRARVLAVKSEQRQRQEGSKAMATSGTPPVTAPDAVAPVTLAPVPSEVLKTEAQGPLSVAKPPVAAAEAAVVTPPEAPLAHSTEEAAELRPPAEQHSADAKTVESPKRRGGTSSPSEMGSRRTPTQASDGGLNVLAKVQN